jgi:hypothetical protein
MLSAASDLRWIVKLESKLTGEADKPRPVMALPAGDDAMDAEVENAGEVMQ